VGGFTSLLGPVGAAFSGLSDVGTALVAFFTEISDYRMWRSLGWLFLGLLMMAAGVTLWLRTEALPGPVI
jgi:hypothetical protein